MSIPANRATRNRLQELTEWLVVRCDPSLPKALTQAMQSFLTARDYDDVALMHSHLQTAIIAAADALDEAVLKRLGWPRHARS